ncbi:class I SAM-dependent methyltransferase [Legionella sp. D16C41]|uniref:class I SAM-dependent methyltransferase n=1 Tax=Legionella sp. D16C41 TaxID=3402688 RepID=UPI003AF79DE2
MGKWTTYFKAHQKSKHHPLVEEAYKKFSDERKVNQQPLNALDLGCGSGRDTVFLLEKGCDVTALDAESEAIEITRARTRHKAGHITFILSKLEEMQLPKQYDLISSNLTLSFVASKHFSDVWSNIVQHIAFNGRFSGQFFGDQHEWANAEQSFFSYAEILNLFRLMFEIEILKVSLTKRETVSDGIKLWHQYDIIACKKHGLQKNL